MTVADLTRLESFFAAYTRRFAGADGQLHPMQQLKVAHSWRVVSNAERIMAAEGWPAEPCLLGRACALLHDTGRFSQYAEFGVFEDHKSVDHAVRGVEVLQAEGVLDNLPAADREVIRVAVRQHNVREVPEAIPAGQVEWVHLVRDADKIDIFRVFEDAIRGGHLNDHPEIAWSLPERGQANPVILAAVRAGCTVGYDQVRSLCDFALIQVGWLQGHLHFDSALALAYERKALDFREEYVRSADDSPAVRDCFAVTRAAILARLNQRRGAVPA